MVPAGTPAVINWRAIWWLSRAKSPKNYLIFFFFLDGEDRPYFQEATCMSGWWKSLSKGTGISVHTAKQAVQSCFSLGFSLQNSARLVIFQALIEQKIHFKCNSSDLTWAGCTIVVLQPSGYTCFAATGVKRTINFGCGSSDLIWIAVLAWDEWSLPQLTG